MEQFFMVLRDGSPYTQYRHSTFESAKREAERLALATPGHKFFVLASVGFAEMQRPVTWTDTDLMPF